jgi:hypothetical protein
MLEGILNRLSFQLKGVDVNGANDFKSLPPESPAVDKLLLLYKASI